MAVVTEDKGRQATSYYTVLEQFEKHCFMQVKPVTGRTHQIRLHLAFVGCPIVGDTIYGLKRPTMPIKRHCLHAGKIKFSLSQEKEAITLEAPLPDDMNNLLTQLRNSNK
jgi:23S rRNA pseudouridine1911/1915/1917 synthase